MRLKASMWIVSLSAFVLFLFPAAALAFDGNLDFHGQVHGCTGQCSYGMPWVGYLTPSGGPSWTPIHAFTVGLVNSALAEDVYVTEINSGFTGGSNFTSANTDLIASGPGNYVIYSTGSTDGYCFFTYDGSAITVTDCSEPPIGPPLDTTTHIVAVNPAGGSTVATSTTGTVGATVYVNSRDFQDGDYVEIKYAPYSAFQSSVANVNGLFTVIRFDVATSGQTILSTSTPLTTQGEYVMTTTLYTPSFFNSILSFFGLGQFANLNALAATSTTFIAGSPSGYDNFVASTTASINDYIASSTISLASCTSFTSFNLGDCMNLLFVPNGQAVVQALTTFKNGFLSYAPWGYVTRFATILGSAGTTSLPVFSATFPLGAPGTSGYFVDNFTLDPNDMLKGGDNALNSVVTTFGTPGLSFQQVTEPFLQDLFAIMVIVAIFIDLTRMRGKSRHGGKTKLH